MFNTAFTNLIDNIFSLPESVLRLVIDKLYGASQLVAQGIDISSWLAPISLLGANWVKVINSLLAGSALVLTFWIGKRLFALYLQVKEAVRWW